MTFVQVVFDLSHSGVGHRLGVLLEELAVDGRKVVLYDELQVDDVLLRILALSHNLPL